MDNNNENSNSYLEDIQIDNFIIIPLINQIYSVYKSKLSKAFLQIEDLLNLSNFINHDEKFENNIIENNTHKLVKAGNYYINYIIKEEIEIFLNEINNCINKQTNDYSKIKINTKFIFLTNNDKNDDQIELELKILKFLYQENIDESKFFNCDYKFLNETDIFKFINSKKKFKDNNIILIFNQKLKFFNENNDNDKNIFIGKWKDKKMPFFEYIKHENSNKKIFIFKNLITNLQLNYFIN